MATSLLASAEARQPLAAQLQNNRTPPTVSAKAPAPPTSRAKIRVLILLGSPESIGIPGTVLVIGLDVAEDYADFKWCFLQAWEGRGVGMKGVWCCTDDHKSSLTLRSPRPPQTASAPHPPTRVRSRLKPPFRRTSTLTCTLSKEG